MKQRPPGFLSETLQVFPLTPEEWLSHHSGVVDHQLDQVKQPLHHKHRAWEAGTDQRSVHPRLIKDGRTVIFTKHCFITHFLTLGRFYNQRSTSTPLLCEDACSSPASWSPIVWTAAQILTFGFTEGSFCFSSFAFSPTWCLSSQTQRDHSSEHPGNPQTCTFSCPEPTQNQWHLWPARPGDPESAAAPQRGPRLPGRRCRRRWRRGVER